MTTREKIIVGVMCLTIVYGAYELLGNRGTPKRSVKKNTNPVEELQTFVASITKKLVNDKVSNEYRYLIDQAGDNWTKDPFIHSITPLRKQLPLVNVPQEPVNQVKPIQPFTYTGFLQLGSTQMAVINGMEYELGETINNRNYVVKSISPLHVVIGKVNSRETIRLPLMEDDDPTENQTP